MPNSRIEIKSTDGTMTDVFIDGHKIHGVRNMRFEKFGHGIPVLSIDLNALDISVDSPFITRQFGTDENMEIRFTDGNVSI